MSSDLICEECGNNDVDCLIPSHVDDCDGQPVQCYICGDCAQEAAEWEYHYEQQQLEMQEYRTNISPDVTSD